MTVPTATWGIIEYRGRTGLEKLEADWRRLYAEMPLRTSFLAYEACTAYADRMAAPDRLRCLALSDGDRVRAICLLEPRTNRVCGLPIRLWGVLWHHHGRQADAVCPDDEARRALVPALVAYLRQKPEGRRVLVLGPAPASSTLWDGLRRLGPGDYCIQPQDSVRVLDCSRSFDELVAGLSKSSRHHLNTPRHRLDAMEDVRFVSATQADELAAEFAAFLDVEASGWKGEAGSGTAVKCDGGHFDIFCNLAANLHGDVDHCEIHALYAEGRCLASIFGTRTGATYSALKTGYDQTYHRVAPGQLLLAKVIERCCSDPDIKQLDLVSPVPWLRGWRTEFVALQLAMVSIGGWPGRAIIALLRFRFGPARRCARWLRATRERLDPRWVALATKVKARVSPRSR
jgi:hypothetical protein